jgi:membrane-bound serine protease (ClpP class)
VPLVVFVAPSGARAASAGFFLAVAADVAAMAPGTHIGAAHPVAGNGQQMDDTVSEKAASDAAAYVRSLATARGRNVALADEAVLESRAFTDTEAAQASPPLVDLIAKDLDDLLRQLDGRTIRRFDGRQHTLHTAGAEQRRVGMTRRQQVLSAIAHPQVAYLLLSLGLLGLTVELWNPGAVLPGVVGGVSLLMAFFAFQILPVSVAGLLLIVLGASLLVAELLAPSFGILGIGGAVALFFGSVMVTDTVPGIRVRYELIVPVVVALAGITLFLGRLALRAQRQAPATGVEGLIGSIGQAMTAIGTDVPGQIGIHGEIWRAVSRTPVASGDRVRVIQVSGLTLVVEAVKPHAAEGGSS